MDTICEHDRAEIESLKQFARFVRGDEMSEEYLNRLNKNYARILTIASIHSSLMEVERREL